MKVRTRPILIVNSKRPNESEVEETALVNYVGQFLLMPPFSAIMVRLTIETRMIVVSTEHNLRTSREWLLSIIVMPFLQSSLGSAMYYPCCDQRLTTPDRMTGTSVLDKEADFKHRA